MLNLACQKNLEEGTCVVEVNLPNNRIRTGITLNGMVFFLSMYAKTQDSESRKRMLKKNNSSRSIAKPNLD